MLKIAYVVIPAHGSIICITYGIRRFTHTSYIRRLLPLRITIPNENTMYNKANFHINWYNFTSSWQCVENNLRQRSTIVFEMIRT